MVKIIDGSHPKCPVAIKASNGDFLVRYQLGIFKRKEYRWGDVAHLSGIESESFRHAGKAAVGAVVGGVLTGGIGLLAGAVIGGRRRKEASYLLKMADGNHLAFSTTDRATIDFLDAKLLRGKHGIESDAP